VLDMEPIKARHEPTSPGRWVRVEQDPGWDSVPPLPPDQTVIVDDAVYGEHIAVFSSEQDEADAEFVAHAHEDVPLLIAEVERLRGERAELQAALEGMCLQFGHVTERDGDRWLGTMGLSNLEWAFALLGWDDPHPIPPGS
jgi:hypothetical protein